MIRVAPGITITDRNLLYTEQVHNGTATRFVFRTGGAGGTTGSNGLETLVVENNTMFPSALRTFVSSEHF